MRDLTHNTGGKGRYITWSQLIWLTPSGSVESDGQPIYLKDHCVIAGRWPYGSRILPWRAEEYTQAECEAAYAEYKIERKRLKVEITNLLQTVDIEGKQLKLIAEYESNQNSGCSEAIIQKVLGR